MDKKIKKLELLLLSAGISIFLYVLLHEIGHTIVMLYAGATITDFSIITAHVSATNGSYTNLSDLWLNANGALLPIIVSFIYSLIYKKSSTNSFYRIFSYMFTLTSTASILAWVMVPFIYLQGDAPANDDVTKFLHNFSHDFHPLIVSAVAVIIIVVCIVTMIKKRIIQNFVAEVKEK